ncbi:MAG: hypothetical protein ABR573_11225 [Candidatus Dormibacteria bacterium]
MVRSSSRSSPRDEYEEEHLRGAANVPLEGLDSSAEIIERVRKGDWETVPVSTPEGKLIGLARREDMEAALDAEAGPGPSKALA